MFDKTLNKPLFWYYTKFVLPYLIYKLCIKKTSVFFAVAEKLNLFRFTIFSAFQTIDFRVWILSVIKICPDTDKCPYDADYGQNRYVAGSLGQI